MSKLRPCNTYIPQKQRLLRYFSTNKIMFTSQDSIKWERSVNLPNLVGTSYDYYTINARNKIYIYENLNTFTSLDGINFNLSGTRTERLLRFMYSEYYDCFFAIEPSTSTSAKLYKSLDGINFNLVSSLPNNISVPYLVLDGANIYVARPKVGVSPYSNIYKSTDIGETWTTIYTVSDISFTGFYKVDSTFILFEGLTLKTSSDAITWTTKTTSTTSTFTSFCSNGSSNYLAVGNSGARAYSTDSGSTWTFSALGSSNISSLIYYNSLFNCVINNDIYSSTDMINFTLRLSTTDDKISPLVG